MSTRNKRYYEVQFGNVVVCKEIDRDTGDTLRTNSVAAYELPHQAQDVAATLNKWAERETE